MKRQLKVWLNDSWLYPRYIGVVYMVPAMQRAASFATGTCVDIGCGLRRYEPIYRTKVSAYIGLDWPQNLDRARPDVMADAQQVPLTDQCADTVLATELMEHLPDPAIFLREVTRILRPGGVFIFSVPFLEPLHEEPRDYLRFTPYSLGRLMQQWGFVIETLEQRGGWWSVVLGSFINQAIYDWASPAGPMGIRRYSWLTPIVLPICAMAQFAAYYLDKVFNNPKYTLGYVVVARLQKSLQGNIQSEVV